MLLCASNLDTSQRPPADAGGIAIHKLFALATVSDAACLGDSSLWLVHAHLIQQSGSSVVKQASSVPAELTPLMIIASMSHLDVPEVLRNVPLNLPSNK